jgi:hypothetical protein
MFYNYLHSISQQFEEALLYGIEQADQSIVFDLSGCVYFWYEDYV